jgi:DNA repair protein RadA/Sms
VPYVSSMVEPTTRSTRSKTLHRCAECGWETAKWAGRCAECQAWGTVEPVGGAWAHTRAHSVTAPARPITDIGGQPATARPSGVAELDRVLGGGMVPGAVLLLAGEPGVGKSTLLLEVAAQTANHGARTLYITGEESAAQVRLRAERTQSLTPGLLLAAETDLGAVLTHVDQIRPQLLVIDSVQAVASQEVDGVAGGVTQVREVAAMLARVAKERDIATVLVGHVTKDGSIAGPRLLEHLVDVVLQFEGDRSSSLRIVRAVKNRYGPVDEVGCFDLGDEGIVQIADPTGLFVSRHADPVPGTCVTVTQHGRRPILAEIQALVTPSLGGSPRHSTSGLDSARVSMTIAVLRRRAGLRLSHADIFAATVGGARLADPSADLATAIAIASAASDRVVPQSMVALGEVGLAGELRRIPGLRKRLAEAARLGFTHAIVPSDLGPQPASRPDLTGLTVLDVPDLGQALRVLGLIEETPRPKGPPRLRAIDGQGGC